MSRIETLFHQHKARVAYFTAGDGGIQHSLEVALALIAGGVNLLEIGIPFSDPVADGPVIQRASQRAIAAGTTLADVLWLITEIRKHSDIPLILFSYLNPILAASRSDFFAQAKIAGVDGLLLVDCPLEESASIRDLCIHHGIDLIYIITPSTPMERMQRIVQQARGFLYYACRKGTTGVRNALPEGFEEAMSTIKSITHLPVIVGFGISNADMVSNVFKFADGAVIGSLFVKAIEEGVPLTSLSKTAMEMWPDAVLCTPNPSKGYVMPILRPAACPRDPWIPRIKRGK